MTRKAVISARFSPRKNSADCESIETQIARCSAYCASRGYDVIGTFEDRAISGKSLEGREGLEQAIQLACRQKAVLCVYSLDRLARSARDALAVLDRLGAAGADLAMLDLCLDTSTPIGRVVFTVLAAVGELERHRIAEKTSDALLRYQADGYLVSRAPAYGYREIEPEHTTRADGTPRVRRRIAPDEAEQFVISEIIRLRAEQRTPSQTASILNSRGFACRSKAWTRSKVCKVLNRARSKSAAS